jgi:hypothetical protein
MRSPTHKLEASPSAPATPGNRSLRSIFSLASASLATQMLVAGIICAWIGLGVCVLLLPATARAYVEGNRIQPILAWLFGAVAAGAMSALLMRRLAARLIHGLDALRGVAGYVIRGDLQPLDLMPAAK